MGDQVSPHRQFIAHNALEENPASRDVRGDEGLEEWPQADDFVELTDALQTGWLPEFGSRSEVRDRSQGLLPGGHR